MKRLVGLDLSNQRAGLSCTGTVQWEAWFISHCPMRGLIHLSWSNERPALSCTVQWQGCFILHCPMTGLFYLALSNGRAVLSCTVQWEGWLILHCPITRLFYFALLKWRLIYLALYCVHTLYTVFSGRILKSIRPPWYLFGDQREIIRIRKGIQEKV